MTMEKSREKNDWKMDATDGNGGCVSAPILHTDGEKAYVFRLYVSGTTPNSLRAIENMRKICEDHLKGKYQLEVIDIYQQPQSARDKQIVAAPTLIRELPIPVRRVIGDLSNTHDVLLSLELLLGNNSG